jgi:hypothetical protein
MASNPFHLEQTLPFDTYYTSPFTLNKKSGFVVYYHNDFDGMLSACLFNLRASAVFNIPTNRMVNQAIGYEQETELASACKEIKKEMKLDHLYLIFLDYDPTKAPIKDLEASKISHFATIDHHAYPNTSCRLVTHSASSPSCADLVAQRFPHPHPKEVKRKIDKALWAARVIDTGGYFVGFEKFKEAILTPPGCLLIYSINNRLTPPQSLRVLYRYVRGETTIEDSSMFGELIDSNRRYLDHEEVPTEVYDILTPGVGNKTMRAALYVFEDTPIDNVCCTMTTFKATSGKYPHEFSIIIQKVAKDLYRVSVRSQVPGFNVNDFCQIFGGGGRLQGMGGFTLRTTSTTLREHIARTINEIQEAMFRMPATIEANAKRHQTCFSCGVWLKENDWVNPDEEAD